MPIYGDTQHDGHHNYNPLRALPINKCRTSTVAVYETIERIDPDSALIANPEEHDVLDRDWVKEGCSRKSITPLDSGAVAMPLTVSKHPTFYWHVPGGVAPQLRFVLRPVSDESVLIYETYMEVPRTDSIVSLTLPEVPAKALAVGETYRWYLVAVCDLEKPREGIVIDGRIERVELSDRLASSLRQTRTREHPSLYAAAGIWHEAMSSFVRQRQLNPYGAVLCQQWFNFLHSVGFAQYTNVPIVPWSPLEADR